MYLFKLEFSSFPDIYPGVGLLNYMVALFLVGFFFLCFLELNLWHTEVPRLGVKMELQLLAWATATATPDPSCICDLHDSLGQCQILNPLSEPRDQTRTLTDASQVLIPPGCDRNSQVSQLVPT